MTAVSYCGSGVCPVPCDLAVVAATGSATAPGPAATAAVAAAAVGTGLAAVAAAGTGPARIGKSVQRVFGKAAYRYETASKSIGFENLSKSFRLGFLEYLCSKEQNFLRRNDLQTTNFV